MTPPGPTESRGCLVLVGALALIPFAVLMLYLGIPPGWFVLVMAGAAGVMVGACALVDRIRGPAK